MTKKGEYIRDNLDPWRIGQVLHVCPWCGRQWVARTEGPGNDTGWTGFFSAFIGVHERNCRRRTPQERKKNADDDRRRWKRRPLQHIAVIDTEEYEVMWKGYDLSNEEGREVGKGHVATGVPRYYLALAYSHGLVQEWLWLYHISARTVRYVLDMSSVRGKEDYGVIIFPGWYDHTTTEEKLEAGNFVLFRPEGPVYYADDQKPVVRDGVIIDWKKKEANDGEKRPTGG